MEDWIKTQFRLAVFFAAEALSTPKHRTVAFFEDRIGKRLTQVAPLGEHSARVGAVWSTAREDFFVSTFKLSQEESSVATARVGYGNIVHQLEVEGSHILVCARCFIGDVPEFNSWFTNLLATSQ